MADATERMAEALRWQAEACARLGSPLYASLLHASADDVTDEGPTWAVMRGHEDDPQSTYPGVRLMGAAHRLVLEGKAPDLAAHYPSAGGSPQEPWPAFRAVLEEHRDEIRSLLERPIQTNEVGRSAAILGAFLLVAERTRLPMRLLEVGASAGLNLRWDRYRYESDGWAWGDPTSPVIFREVFEDERPPSPPVDVAERCGCDLQPVDPSTEDGRLTLLSFVWADQTHRFESLRGALEIARDVPAAVDREDAATWLEDRLAHPADGLVTVVFHTITLGYFSEDSLSRLAATVDRAVAAATADAPFAWLGMEIEEMRFPVTLRLAPGDEKERVVGYASAHGPPVRWLG